LAVIAAILASVAAIAAPAALADGDPASDVLVNYSYFNPYDSGIAPATAEHLGAVLAASAKAGVPIRVAMINSPTDLGTVTQLWRNPLGYSQFLWYELKGLYKGQVLVVMPNGFGLWGPSSGRYAVTAAERAVEAPSPSAGPGLANAAIAAVPLLARAAGHPFTTAGLHVATVSSSGGGMPLAAWIALLAGALVIMLAWRASLRARPLSKGLLLALVALALVPGHALADGDPGSDVLVDQNLFSTTLSTSQQVQLGNLLTATQTAGAPVRVAIIAAPDDLGTLTPLWHQPQPYANYLAQELLNAYSGRLLIVMPNGFGIEWRAHQAGLDTIAHALAGVHIAGDSPAALFSATRAAVYRIESAAGVDQAKLTAHPSSKTGGGAAGTGSSSPAATAHPTSVPPKSQHQTPGAIAVIIAVLLLVAYVAWRRGMKLPKVRLRRPGVRVRPIAFLPTLLLAIVIVALVLNHTSSSSGSVSFATAARNPSLDTGTALTPKPAPNFTLTDETGHQISLRQYRGKVVVLAFIDAECETICPLTTQAMLDAKASLGAAGKDVQLLGVNANWKSHQIEDVLTFTQLHGLTGQWHFLTGDDAELEHVWNLYHVNEQTLIDEDSNAIDHVAALYVIDQKGRLRRLYLTQSSYSAIPQFGQLLAHEISSVLPSHPAVSTNYSYQHISGITPAQTTTLPRYGGGHVTLGPGRSHLYMFFSTWDTQTTAIAYELSLLNRYQQAARAGGLPQLTAIDEGSVEPDAGALPTFMKTLSQQPTYPVAIDQSGKVADGYDVEGQPWFVLTSATGQIVWYQEVYTAGWPSLTGLEKEVRAALSKAPVVPTSDRAAQHDLAGSPPALAALHAQASELLPGGAASLYKRISELTKAGYPVVVNIWASTCQPCEDEFHLFSNAAALYGTKVAFLGADNEDIAGLAKAFLKSHPVTYPSYATQTAQLDLLLTGGLQGTPTTVYIAPNGKVIYTHLGAYKVQGSLDLDIEDYALGGAS